MTATATAAEHRETCRLVMGMAWASKCAEPGRTFGDCLRGAWAFAKRSAAAAAKFARAAAWGMTHGRPVRIRDTCPRLNVRAAIAAGKSTKATMGGANHYLRGR